MEIATLMLVFANSIHDKISSSAENGFYEKELNEFVDECYLCITIRFFNKTDTLTKMKMYTIH